MRTEPETTKKEFSGEAFLCAGCVVLKTGAGIYTIEDDEFAGKVVALLRENDVREPKRADAVVEVEVGATRTYSAEYVPAGWNYLAHSEQTTTYDVQFVFVRHRGKSFYAGPDVRAEIAATEQIGWEF